MGKAFTENQGHSNTDAATGTPSHTRRDSSAYVGISVELLKVGELRHQNDLFLSQLTCDVAPEPGISFERVIATARCVLPQPDRPSNTSHSAGCFPYMSAAVEVSTTPAGSHQSAQVSPEHSAATCPGARAHAAGPPLVRVVLGVCIRRGGLCHTADGQTESPAARILCPGTAHSVVWGLLLLHRREHHHLLHVCLPH